MCRYESLLDGTLDLSDIAAMNDELMAEADNMRLMREREESTYGK
jgi:hypothetical protein